MPNKPINADSQKLRSFVAPLSAAGYGQRWTYLTLILERSENAL